MYILLSSADLIEHTFIDSKEFAKLYSQIVSWLNLCQGTVITLLNEKNCFSWRTSQNWCAFRPRKTQATFAHNLGQTRHLFLLKSSERPLFRWTCKQTNYSMEVIKILLKFNIVYFNSNFNGIWKNKEKD